MSLAEIYNNYPANRGFLVSAGFHGNHSNGAYCKNNRFFKPGYVNSKLLFWVVLTGLTFMAYGWSRHAKFFFSFGFSKILSCHQERKSRTGCSRRLSQLSPCGQLAGHPANTDSCKIPIRIFFYRLLRTPSIEDTNSWYRRVPAITGTDCMKILIKNEI